MMGQWLREEGACLCPGRERMRAFRHVPTRLRPACSRLRLGRLSRGTRGPTAQHGPASGVAGGSKCRWTLPAKWVRTERTRILTDYLIAILGP